MIGEAFSTNGDNRYDRNGDGKGTTISCTGSAEGHRLCDDGEFGSCTYGEVVRDYRGRARRGRGEQ